MIQEHNIKVVMLGYEGVGKTSITNVFESDAFDINEKSTCGAAFKTKISIFDDSKFKFQIWDTAGQEKYQSLISLYYKDAQVALLVFNITDPKSFERIKIWVDFLSDRKDELIMILVGNKSDLVNDIEIAKIPNYQNYAASKNLPFKIVSARHNVGIEEIFQFAVEEIQQRNSKLKKIDNMNY